MEQLDMFDLLNETFGLNEKKVSVVSKTKKPAPVNKVPATTIPQILKEEEKHLQELMSPVPQLADIKEYLESKYFAFRTIVFKVRSRNYWVKDRYFTVANNRLREMDGYNPIEDDIIVDINHAFDFSINLVQVLEGTAFSLPITVKIDPSQSWPKISVGKYRKWQRLTTYSNLLLTDPADMLRQAEEYYPYRLNAFKGLQKKYGDFPIEFLFCCPQLEQLDKMNFPFMSQIMRCLSDPFYGSSTIEHFNRLCHYGTKPKEIFQCSKMLYEMLRTYNEADLAIWDRFRKFEKQTKLNLSELRDVYLAAWRDDELDKAYRILNFCQPNGKRLFTWASLNNYLQRLDMYEAINRHEALPLLHDYLIMCKQLEVKACVTGDSLKREHDVMARNVRMHRNEALSEKMLPACEKMTEYNYEEEIFFIRGIKSYDDLIDEATQQANCVAGYAQSIIDGESMIYVMRAKARADCSLITVELDPHENKIRQKFLAHNRPVRNRAQSEFLDRWLKFVIEKRSMERRKTA